MGGGSNEVKETKYQKELAKIASSEWDRYKDVYQPLEDQYMKNIDQLGGEASYKSIAGDVNAAYQKQFSNQAQQQQKQLAAAGVDPSSGKAQAARQQLADSQASSASQAQSQGQHSVTESYAGGLSNITAMGKGQQTQAINSLSDLGQAAQNKAISDAQSEASELSVPGALAGAAASYAAANPDQVKSGLSSLSNKAAGAFNNATGGTSLDAQNQIGFGQMYS